MASKAPEKPSRRTQVERSHAMRERLISATICCLDRDGYAGTTFKTIVTEAEVSLGAPLHHFATKAALMEAAATRLIQRLYIELGKAFSGLASSDNRLTEMIQIGWSTLFNQQETIALLELTLASRRDTELAEVMRKLGLAGFDMLDNAAKHYFVSRSSEDPVSDYFVLTHWLIRGMTIDQHLLSSSAAPDHYLRLWSGLLQGKVAVKPEVVAAPPKPKRWPSDKPSP